MSLILNIETATKNCSVSLSNHGAVINCIEVAEQGYSHAEKLHVFIEQVLLESGVQFNDLKAIAVSQGPGSYTGLRIGISAAKGLCYSLDIPLIAIDTLEVLARQFPISEGYIIPMIDARRMEVYSAVFNAQYQKIRNTQAEIITNDSFHEFDGIISFVGDAVAKGKEILTQDNFVFKEEIVYPSSREMARLSYEKYQKLDFVDVAYFEPLYLKDFLATTPKKAI